MAPETCFLFRTRCSNTLCTTPALWLRKLPISIVVVADGFGPLTRERKHFKSQNQFLWSCLSETVNIISPLVEPLRSPVMWNIQEKGMENV